jgi:hypothetical protein
MFGGAHTHGRRDLRVVGGRAKRPAKGGLGKDEFQPCDQGNSVRSGRTPGLIPPKLTLAVSNEPEGRRRELVGKKDKRAVLFCPPPAPYTITKSFTVSAVLAVTVAKWVMPAATLPLLS